MNDKSKQPTKSAPKTSSEGSTVRKPPIDSTHSAKPDLQKSNKIPTYQAPPKPSKPKE